MTIRRVAFIGAYDPAYSRHAVLIEALTAHGIAVDQYPLPRKATTRARWAHLARHWPQARKADVVIIPAFNQTSAPLAWLLGKAAPARIALDYLTGLTDTLEDRGHTAPWKQTLYRAIDRFNIRHLPTLTDTEAHRRHYARLLGVPIQRMAVVPVGVRSALLDTVLDPPPTDIFIAQYIGTFIPFHGVDTILYAAKLLSYIKHLRFELVGDGQTYPAMTQLAKSLALHNVTFTRGYFPPKDLFPIASRASLFLGVFGDADKTRYVVPTKVYEGLALDRPLITAQSPALESLFRDGEHLLTVPPNNPTALAEAIHKLITTPELYQRVRQSGNLYVQERYNPRQIGAILLEALQAL